MAQLTEFNAICEKHGIGLAYLFGSEAEAGYQSLLGQKVAIPDPLADIDLGVIFLVHDRLAMTDRRYLLYADICNDLAVFFPTGKLDLVFLQETHAVFQAQAMLGRCVYAASAAFRGDYEHRILARAADFRIVLDRYYAERRG